MTAAVLFDFNRPDCKLGPVLLTLAEFEPNHGRRGSLSGLMGNDLMGC